MKYQVLFSQKNNEKVFISHAAVMIGTLRVKYLFINYNDTDKVVHNSCIKIFWGNKLIIGMICVCHHCKIVDPFSF